MIITTDIIIIIIASLVLVRPSAIHTITNYYFHCYYSSYWQYP